MRTRFTPGVVVVVALAGRVVALAQAAPERKRGLEESLSASANPLGLQHVLELRWTRSLTTSHDRFLAGAHAAAGLSHYLTPSYTRLGAWAEIAPLSVLELRAGVEPGVYFGTFGSLLSFDSYAASFDDDRRDLRRNEARSGTGSRLYLSPTLRMQVGQFVAASSANLEWWRSSVDGPFFYEPSRDTLLAVGGDRLLALTNVVLLRRDLAGRGTFSCGVAHFLTYVFDAPRNRSQRLGVTLVRQFGPKRFGIRAPRLGGQVSYYLDHPSRKGQLNAGVGLSIRLAP